ncbi:SusC/RagA family TonB-linked outer membrane protein [Mucilaginibacter sp. BJC16-A38]|uniref:SusC/RagA family TonB-linked outer membrane protein n=1 Tax=Mucilaginibacter phenanthrenivorans TaxID=1234842 RepID=UPI0021588C81|nr:SusC/RagA family TonB-linked outer membrane protein [Mucilaginibacter phenanthrenivorans]MCR8556609.1 SusC/RagA family TonB-linked outer membrane protein [Mucilaginibacter phenanthrenivorans]
MQKLDLSAFLKCCCFLLALLGQSVYGFGQTALASNNSFHLKARNLTVQQVGENKVLLKDALDNLKKQFKIQIAYHEGLLDNKFVPASLVTNARMFNLDDNLKQLLSVFQLEYRKINDNQISIFSLKESSDNRVAALVVVTGKVVDAASNEPISDASVLLKADPKIGTSTDASGNFKLVIPDKYADKAIVLQVVYIGYDRGELTVSNPAEPVQIKLKKNTSTLNEVVVTALGISKQRKSLGYSVTEVKGSEFTQARENNVANGLSGKIAGVNAAGLSTGPGGSSRIVIRGNGGLAGDNQPLYVVNGMPIDNSVPGGPPTTNGTTNNVDRGDGIGAINPDDIETISVLKGGTAAALYGSRAANGVILITTKKGRAQKGIGIEFNTTATYDNVAVFPDYQYEYGQGDGGVKPLTLAQAQATGRRSWGAKIDGSTDYVAVDGKTHPYVAQKDNLKNYYQTGSTYTNSLAFVGGNEGITYRFSLADLNSRGILPGTTYDRKTFNLALNAKLSSKISVEALAQYNIETGHNRTGAGDALGNPNWTPLEVANTVDIRWLKPGYDANGNEIVWNDAAIASNGYFVINKFKEDDVKDRFIGQGSVLYTPIKDLTFKATLSRDFYNYTYSNILPSGTLYMLTGQYQGIQSDVSETNELVTGTYKTKIVKDINVSILGGVNGRQNVTNQQTTDGSQFTIPFFYSTTNLAKIKTTPYYAKIVTNSIFGSADFDYKSLLFLSFTGRKDWFSTLSPQNNSIFYPSIGGSFILSDAVKLPEFFTLAKLRASWAQVGGGTPDAYKINLAYLSIPSAGPPLQNVSSNDITNSHLKPYTSTTSEAGIELQMLQNRLGLDVTVYNRKTTNDIVNTAISSTSGYNNVILNVGEMDNKGIEVMLDGSPVKSKIFSWNVSYNVAYNDNKIVRLAPGLSTIQLAATVNNYGLLNNTEGLAFGTIYTTQMAKNANGQVIFNKTTGLPVATGYTPLGKSVAPVTMGLTNEFRYKRFSLSFLLDGKFGNKVFSEADVYATRLGLTKMTLPGRENGLVLNGVDQTGAPYTRTVPVSGLRTYYDNYKIYSDLFLHDGSFVKLRQVILSYNLPVLDLKAVNIQSATISLVSRNLWTIYKKTDNFDPEQSFTNSNDQGFESIGLPRTRSLGVNLSVKF